MNKSKHKSDTTGQTDKAGDGFVSLKVDYAFVSVMKNQLVLKGFISAVLGLDPGSIQEIAILDRHLNRRFADDKLGILDVRAKIKDIGDIDIEVQVRRFRAWGERIVYYSDKMYIEGMEKGDYYHQNTRVISISILDFVCLKGDYFYSPFHIWHDWEREMLTAAKEYHIIELAKLHRSVPRAEHQNLMKWCQLIKAESEEERMTIEQDEYIREALKELEKISNDPEKREEYDLRDKAIKDYVTGLKEATEDGIELGIEYNLRCLNKLLEKLKMTDELHLLPEAIQNEEVRNRLFKKHEIE